MAPRSNIYGKIIWNKNHGTTGTSLCIYKNKKRVNYHAGDSKNERDEEGSSPLADILPVVQVAKLGGLLGQTSLHTQQVAVSHGTSLLMQKILTNRAFSLTDRKLYTVPVHSFKKLLSK
jgi:hypothetical protein